MATFDIDDDDSWQEEDCEASLIYNISELEEEE